MPDPKDLFKGLENVSVGLEPIIGDLDTSHLEEMLVSGIDQGEVNEAFWMTIMDALRSKLPDEQFQNIVADITEKIERAFKPPVLPPPVVGSTDPNVVMPGPGKVTGYPTGIKTSVLLESLTQIEQVMKDFRLPGLDLSSIITGGVDAPNLEDVLGSLDPREIENLLLDVTELQDRLNQLNINPDILEGINYQLNDYITNLQAAVIGQDRLNERVGDTQKVGSLTEAFLGRYKYALLLVGGALTGMFAMVQHSSVFGTMLDLFGTAVGYLADVLLWPTIPVLMWFIELIIGVADWISDLPEPLRMVISGFLLLSSALLILRSLGMATVFKKILDGILSLIPALTVAGALTTTGLIVGIIAGLAAGFAVVYLMVQTGIINAIATAGRTVQEKAPWLTDILAAVLAPIGILGAIVIDLVTGQWDKIPEHIGSIMQIWLNSVKALAARIIWVFQQIGNAVMILVVGSFAKAGEAIGGLISGFGGLASSIISSIDEMTKSFRGWIKLIGEGLNVIGMTTLGNPMVAFGNATEGISGMKQTADDLKSYGEGVTSFWKSVGDATGPAAAGFSSRWESIWKEMESKNADLLKLNQGEFQPGSVLNGITSSDQISALTKQYREELLKTIKQTNADLNFAGIDTRISAPVLDDMDLSGYQEMSNQIKKIQEETLNLIDTQNLANESGVKNSKITLDRLKEIEKGVTDINSITGTDIVTDVTTKATKMPSMDIAGTGMIASSMSSDIETMMNSAADEMRDAFTIAIGEIRSAFALLAEEIRTVLKESEQLYRGGPLPTSGSPAPELAKTEYVYVAKGDKTSDEPRVLQVNISGRFSNDEELYQQFIKKLSRESRFSV